MRIRPSYFLLPLLALVSCHKTEDAPDMNAGTSVVSFGMTEKSGAKLFDFDKERSISSLQVYVFFPDGTINAGGFAENNAGTLMLTVTRGHGMSAYAMVNYPDVSSKIAREDDLLALADSSIGNALSSFVMTGRSKGVDIDGTTVSVEIPVDRLAAKIRLNQVYNNLPPSVGDITVTGVFLSNVVTRSYLYGEAFDPLWVNCRGRDLSELPQFTDLGLGITVKNRTSASVDGTFYCYGNPTTADSTSETWCARHTRLVVRAVVDGQVYYYPISINANIPDKIIRDNHQYTITTLTVNRIGSTDPEAIIQPTDVAFSIIVEEWWSNDEDISVN